MIVDAVLASALASAAVPIVICMAAGSEVGRGDSRWPGADMLVGFGLLGGALTVLAVATPVPLSGLMIALTTPNARQRRMEQSRDDRERQCRHAGHPQHPPRRRLLPHVGFWARP